MRGSRCATSHRQLHMQIRGRRCGMTGPAAAWTGTRRTSSPPTSQAPLGRGTPAGGRPRPTAPAAGRGRPQDEAITYGDAGTNANRRSGRQPGSPDSAPLPRRNGRSAWCWRPPQLARSRVEVRRVLALQSAQRKSLQPTLAVHLLRLMGLHPAGWRIRLMPRSLSPLPSRSSPVAAHEDVVSAHGWFSGSSRSRP
jgi:hypothetical protein